MNRQRRTAAEVSEEDVYQYLHTIMGLATSQLESNNPQWHPLPLPLPLWLCRLISHLSRRYLHTSSVPQHHEVQLKFFLQQKEDFILWTLKNIETQSFFTDSDMYGTMKKLIGFSIHMLSMCFSLCIKTSFRAQSSDWKLIKALKLVEDSNLLGVLIFSWSLSFPQQWWKQRNRTVVLAYFTVDHHFSKLFFKWFCH